MALCGVKFVLSIVAGRNQVTSTYVRKLKQI